MFQDNIITESTRQIMEYIGHARRDDLNLPWPGRVFEIGTEEGKALLATPQGVGVAYLIKDHSNFLVRKAPRGVRIFTVDSTGSGSGGSEVGLEGGVLLYALGAVDRDKPLLNMSVKQK